MLTVPLQYAIGQSDCAGQLTGRIVGGDTRDGLPGATVLVRETGKGTAADSTGRFRLAELCAGAYTLEYRFVGYTTQLRRVRVPADSTLPLVTLVPDNVSLQEVQVTEHRSEAQQLLQTQTQLTGQSLAATRGQSLGESLKAMTGLYSIQTGPSISKPVIHGLHSNRILILNNGVRQEDQQWGSEHAPEIDAFLASRLTVIKGAASIRYGSDAIGGVILVEPKAMPTKLGMGGELNLVGATNGRLGVVSGIVEQALGGKLTGLSWRLQGTLKKAGYGRTPHYFLENTSYQENNVSGDIHYDHKNIGAEVFYSQFYTKIGLFTGAQVGSLSDLYLAIARPEPLEQPGFSYDLGRPYQEVRHDLLKLRAFVRTKRGTLTTTLARQQNNRQEFDYISFSGALNPELYLQLITHTTDLIWEPTPKTDKKGGIFSGSVGLSGITQGNVRKYLFLIPNYRNYGIGAFAIERYARDRWTYEAGLRADYRWLRAYFLDEATSRTYFDTRHWQNLTGSLGASYQLSPAFELSANLSTAWRAPNASELYANGLHQSAVAYERGNPSLQQEQAYNGNVSIEYAGKRLSAELGFYNNLIQNYIYLKPDSVPIIRQRGAFPSYSYNQVRASFRGIDATIRYQFTDRLLLTSKTSLLFAYDHTNHDYLVFIPPNRTDNSLRYQFANQGRVSDFYASLSGLLVARQNRAPAVTQQQENGQIIFKGDFAPPPAGYFLVGAEVGMNYRLVNQPLSIILTGSNLLDHAYRDYLDRFRYFTDALGRNISLKLNLKF